MTNFWLSWIHRDGIGAFEIHTPWWVSGHRMAARGDEELDEPTIVAAVQADDEDAAKEKVMSAFDKRPAWLEWRFCEPRAPEWEPFSGRFPRADWMQWPPLPDASHG